MKKISITIALLTTVTTMLMASDPTELMTTMPKSTIKWILISVAGVFYLFFGTGRIDKVNADSYENYGSLTGSDDAIRNNAKKLLSKRPEQEKYHTYEENNHDGKLDSIQVTTTTNKGEKRFWEYFHEDNFSK